MSRSFLQVQHQTAQLGSQEQLFFLKKFGKWIKKTGDKVGTRLFRDLPKATVNAVTAPFTKKPVFGIEDFQDKKYGAATVKPKNRAIVAAGGQIATAAILGPTLAAQSAAGAGATTGYKVFNTISQAKGIYDVAKSLKQPAQPAAEPVYTQTNDLPDAPPRSESTDNTTRNTLVVAAAVLIVLILIFWS